MSLSLLQLNINSDNFWEKLPPFLAEHDFDIIQLQELTGKATISGNINSKRDVFEELQKVLQKEYNGKLAISEKFSSSPSSYMGNATFFKKKFSLLKENLVYLYQRKEPFPSNATTFEGEGRTVLHLQLDMNGKRVSFLNTHFAWAKSPIQEPHQTEQAKKLINYLKTVNEPFIFSGDLNLNPIQPMIQELSILARNLTIEYNLTNTLNPRTHRAQHLFPPGIAVDYIFVSKEITVKNFEVITEDLSDHYGLSCTFSL